MRYLFVGVCFFVWLGFSATTVWGQQMVGDLFVYAAEGQSRDQQSRDMWECQDWARQTTGFDMKKPLICAVDEVFECNEYDGCERRSEKEANVPTFFRVAFDKKKLTAKKQDGQQRESDIGATEELETVLILKGTQNDQAWNMVIGKEEGTMSTTVTGDQFSFVMFGDCTTLD